MTKAELDAIRERVSKATLGPWESDGGASNGEPVRPYYSRGAFITDAHFQDIVCGGQEEQGDPVGVLLNADADFIAHARDDIPALIAEIERLNKVLDNAEHWSTESLGVEP